MKETFSIKGIDIEVEYNPILYNHSEIEKMLKGGVKSQTRFEEIQAEIEILNEAEVRDKFFASRSKTITKVLDLSNYMSVVTLMGQPLEVLLKQTFDIKIIKHVSNHVYELEGPTKEFKDLEFILNL